MATKRITNLQKRLYTRVPLIGTWLRRWAAKALAQDGSPDVIRALAEAVTRSSDARVRTIALETLQHTDAQPAIDAARAVWAATRHAALADVLTARTWVASAPPDIRVLTVLKMQRRELTTPLGQKLSHHCWLPAVTTTARSHRRGWLWVSW